MTREPGPVTEAGRAPDEARGPEHIGCLFKHEHRYPECYDDALPAPVAGADEDGPPLQEPPPNRECETCGQPVFCGHCYEEDGIAYEERKWEQR